VKPEAQLSRVAARKRPSDAPMLEGAWALRETLFPKDRGQTFPAETTLAHASRTSPPRPRREQRAREHAVGSDLGLRPQAA